MIIGQTNTSESVYVIAEVGGNHNGDPGRALELVEAAAEAGANGVKFQTYRAETLVHPDMESMPLARKYYKKQFERFKSLELDRDVYLKIIERCRSLEIDFLTTPFDLESLEQMADYMPAIKIASGDLTFHPLIKRAVETGKPIILSTGMADEKELMEAASLIPARQRALLHCVSIYPTPDEEANLGAITGLKQLFPDSVIGYSDHTLGALAPLSAAALGARIIEKHFTFDTAQELGDHRLSLDGSGLAAMVKELRRLEKMLQPVPDLSDKERAMRRLLRRGIYAARDLTDGHVLQEEDVRYIRPEIGLKPSDAASVLGKTVGQALKENDAIEHEKLRKP